MIKLKRVISNKQSSPLPLQTKIKSMNFTMKCKEH